MCLKSMLKSQNLGLEHELNFILKYFNKHHPINMFYFSSAFAPRIADCYWSFNGVTIIILFVCCSILSIGASLLF